MRPSLTPLFLTGEKSLLVVFAYASCRKSSALPPDTLMAQAGPLSYLKSLLLLLFDFYVTHVL